MLRSKSPLVDNREIVMMLLHFAVTFCHVTMSFYEDKYCRLLGPFYINYKSRVHQSYHVLVIVMFIFLSERLSIALFPQCPVCQGGHYTSPSVGTLSWIQQCVMVIVIVNVKNKSWSLLLLIVCMTKDATSPSL